MDYGTTGCFKVGDRVKCIEDFEGKEEAVGLEGEVKFVEEGYDDDSYLVAVEFDEYIDGHSGWSGSCKKGHTWNFIERKNEIPMYLERTNLTSRERLARELMEVR